MDARAIEGDGVYGVFFHSQNWENRYTFVIDSNGYYYFYKVTTDNIDWIEENFSSVIIPDVDNHIVISVIEDDIHISVNGTELIRYTITDAAFSEGRIGLIVVRHSEETNNFTAHFDNTLISNPHELLGLSQWPDTIRLPIGFGIAGIILFVSFGLMHGGQTILSIAKTIRRNTILLLSIIVSIPLYILILWPIFDARIPYEIKTTIFPVWWVSTIAGLTILSQRDRSLGFDVALIITAMLTVLPLTPTIAIYFILRSIVERFTTSKQKRERIGYPQTKRSLRIQMLYQLGMYERVIKELERNVSTLRPLQSDPESQVHFNDTLDELGWAYYFAGKLKEAEMVFREGVINGLSPLDHFYNGLAAVSSMASNHEDALLAYAQAIKLSPDEAMFYRNRIQEYLTLGNLTAAKEDYAKVLQLQPNHSITPLRYAQILEREGNYKQAIDYYYKSLSLDCKQPDSRFDFGLCLLKIGKIKEGQKQYECGLRLLQGVKARNTLRGAIYELQQEIPKLPATEEALELLAKLKRGLEHHEREAMR